KISISFSDINRIDALLKLEKETELTFYFDKTWFDESLISKSFTNTDIDDILLEILKETPLNYLIIDKRVVLTKNTAIIDKLPSGFFGKENNKTVEEITNSPVLQKQYITNSNAT